MSFITGVNQAMTDQNNKAFELKLMNAKLEQEHQNRLSEMKAGSEEGVSAREGEAQFSQGLSVIPNDQMNSLAKYANDSIQALRDRKPMPIPPDNLSHPAAQQSLERLQGQFGHAAASMLPVSVHPMDANGQKIVPIFDKGGNLIRTEYMGLNNEGQAAVNKAEASYGTYNSQLLRIRSQLSTFMTAESAGQLPEQAAKITLDKFMQTNPDVKMYFDQKPLQALNGEIDLTHSSRAVQALGSAASQAYPGMTDTVPTAMAKIDNLIAIGRDGIDATYQSYGVGVHQQHYPNIGLQAQLAQQKQAAGASKPAPGSFTPDQVAAEINRRKALGRSK